MPEQTPQSNIPPGELYRQPGAMDHKKNWFALHHILAYLLFGLLAVLVIIGVFYFQSLQSVPDMSPPIHHPIKNAMSDWKTYTNSQYGFEVKIPNDWVIHIDQPYGSGFDSPEHESAENMNSLECQKPEPNDCVLEGVALDIFFSKESGKMNAEGAIKTEKIGDNEFSVYSSGPLEHLNYEISNGSKIVNFGIYLTNNDLVHRILSTFKFTQ